MHYFSNEEGITMNKLSMSNMQDLVGIKPVSNETTLDDCYVTTVQLAIASGTIKNRGDSCYFRLRYEVVQIANEIMKKKGITESKDIDWDLVCAIFITKLEATEKRMDSKADKRPPVWTNAKSQLKAGLEEGFDFIDDPGIGQTALRDVVKATRDAKAEETRQQKIKDEFGEKGLTDTGAADPDKKLEGDAAVGGEDSGNKDASASGGKVKLITPDQEFKDPALAAAVSEFIAKALALEATTGKNRKERTGAQVALNTISAATDTLDTSLESFNNAMAKLAEAS